MPLVNATDFIPPKRYQNGHYSTFVPHIFGKLPHVQYERSRIETHDDDFIDLDYTRTGSNRLAILCHGLEGNSRSGYVILFADQLNAEGWDTMSVNYRGCSGENNRQLRMYNSGSTGDLHLAIQQRLDDYQEIVLIGFSLGGNLVLKYLGEGKYDISSRIKRAVAISTPVHLSDASQQLLKWENILYQWRFLLSLSKKIIAKKRQFPDQVQLSHLLKTTNLYKFDNFYTAPFFGYQDAEEYYAKNQCLQWLDEINVPSLIINAHDDPFLGPKCYPSDLVRDLRQVYLCTPRYGGHVGFAYSRNDRSWLFNKVFDFINR